MISILNTTQLERTVQGAPIILLMAVGAVLALFWIFFPIVVWSRLNETVKLLKEIRDHTSDTARHTRPAGPPPKAESSLKYRVPRPGE